MHLYIDTYLNDAHPTFWALPNEDRKKRFEPDLSVEYRSPTKSMFLAKINKKNVLKNKLNRLPTFSRVSN